MNNPEYVKVNNKKYKINTDFRVALKCNDIAIDNTIGDLERSLAIIYTLYGDEGLNNPDDYNKLLELAQRYLSLDKEIEEIKGEPDMDFNQDMDYIEASFISDYGIDLSKEEMHWWKFFNLMNGLSNSDIGNCCILNRIRNLRNYDVSKIKDNKERNKIIEAQKGVALKKKEPILTKEQEESMANLDRIIGLRKE